MLRSLILSLSLGLGLAELEDQFARLRRRHVLERHRQLERLGAAARARRYHGLDPGVIFILNPDLRTHIHGPARGSLGRATCLGELRLVLGDAVLRRVACDKRGRGVKLCMRFLTARFFTHSLILA